MHLCLSRVPYFAYPFKDLISDDEVIILTDARFYNEYKKAGFRTYEFEDYHINDEVLQVACEICEKMKINYVHACDESDVERAAFIREKYLIEGQKMCSAILYRDKYLMKDSLKNELAVPYFKQVYTKEKALKTLNLYGKCIVKPRKSWSSNNMYIIESSKDLEEIKLSENTMMEEWITAKKMYSVDGIQKNGKVLLSFIHEYDGNVLESLKSKGFAMTTSEKNLNKEFKQKTVNYVEKIINKLNVNEKFTSPFHLEFFLNEKEEFIFCEIAARFGGGKTLKLIDLAFSVNLPKVYLEVLNNNEKKLSKVNYSIDKYYSCLKVFGQSKIKGIDDDWIIFQEHNDSRALVNINSFSSLYIISGNTKEECLEITDNIKKDMY